MSATTDEIQPRYLDGRSPLERRLKTIERDNELLRSCLYDLCETIVDYMEEIPQEALIDIGIEARDIIGRLNGKPPSTS